MNTPRLLKYIPILLLAATTQAQNTDTHGNLNIDLGNLTGSNELNIQLDWPGIDGSYYFIEQTPRLENAFSSIKLYAGARADNSGKLGTTLQTTAPMGFYRLFITDDETHPRLLADDDGDKISNLLEAQAGWDAYELPANVAVDSDGDGIADYWEQFHFGNLDQTAEGDADGDGVSNGREFGFGDNPEEEEEDRTTFVLEVEFDDQEMLGDGLYNDWQELYTNDVAFNHNTTETTRELNYNKIWSNTDVYYKEKTNHNDWINYTIPFSSFTHFHVNTQKYCMITYYDLGHYKFKSFSGSPITLLVKHSEHEAIIEEDTLNKTTAPTGVVNYEVIKWDGEQLTIDGEDVNLPTEERGCLYEYGEVELPYRVDFIAPAGGASNNPVDNPIDGGDGSGEVANNANEFTFSSAAPGILTIQFKAKIGGDEGNKIGESCVFTIGDIGQSAAWAAANPGGKASLSNGYLVATATFTGLPENNSDFGKKNVQLLVGGEIVAETVIEVFFPATATNHPGEGSGSTPNWFYYYKQNAGGGAYGYDPKEGNRSSSESGNGESTILLASYVHDGGNYITTKIEDNQLKATGWSDKKRFYAHFIGVLEHERQHANNQINTGLPDDLDGDRLSNSFEEGTSKTDSTNAWSAKGIFTSLYMSDQEVYAGGPVEENAVLNADTSQDWAAPGTNKKPE